MCSQFGGKKILDNGPHWSFFTEVVYNDFISYTIKNFHQIYENSGGNNKTTATIIWYYVHCQIGLPLLGCLHGGTGASKISWRSPNCLVCHWSCLLFLLFFFFICIITVYMELCVSKVGFQWAHVHQNWTETTLLGHFPILSSSSEAVYPHIPAFG